MINHKARYPAEVAKLLRMHHPIVKLGFSKDQAAALVAGMLSVSNNIYALLTMAGYSR